MDTPDFTFASSILERAPENRGESPHFLKHWSETFVNDIENRKIWREFFSPSSYIEKFDVD